MVPTGSSLLMVSPTPRPAAPTMPPTVRDTPPTAAPIYLQVSWLSESEVKLGRLRTVPVTVVTAPETPLSLLLPVGISAGKCSNRERMLCERLKSGGSYFCL